MPELLKVETISVDWIKKNVKVYSKELDLKTAQKIPGLRAVFGESYPDPVRVVTLEFDIEEMSQDIENSKWRNTSVEFCGGTCVCSTFIPHLTTKQLLAMSRRQRTSRTLSSPRSRVSPRVYGVSLL